MVDAEMKASLAFAWTWGGSCLPCLKQGNDTKRWQPIGEDLLWCPGAYTRVDTVQG